MASPKSPVSELKQATAAILAMIVASVGLSFGVLKILRSDHAMAFVFLPVGFFIAFSLSIAGLGVISFWKAFRFISRDEILSQATPDQRKAAFKNLFYGMILAFIGAAIPGAVLVRVIEPLAEAAKAIQAVLR